MSVPLERGGRTGGRRRAGGARGERRMVPAAEPRSYYGRPVIKAPVWKPEVPVYFFAGGMAGGASTLALAADALGNRTLARRAWIVAFAGMAASPPLLIADLGRPERFLNMLRVFKPSSPMSMGAWILSGYGASVPLVLAHELTGAFARLDPVGRVGAGVLGPLLSTYTAVLVANTAVPVWHEAHRELPFVFAAGSAASAGAAVAIASPAACAAPARRLAVGGALAELGSMTLMERRLGPLGEPYRHGESGRIARRSKLLTAAGAAVLARGRRRRSSAIVGGGLVLAGALLERRAIFTAGFASAADPTYTVGPQRTRLDRARQAS